MHAPTQVDQQLAQAQKRHAGDPQRAEIITRARRFKASWFELAEVLTACQQKKLYTKWGYAGFEEYYRKELRLKSTTVNKLVGNFVYLRKVAPEVLERDGVAEPIPSPESVEFLRKSAELCARGEVPGELLDQVRLAVVDEAMAAGKLERKFGPALFPKDDAAQVVKKRRDAARTANQLVTRLETLRGSLPEGVLSQASEALAQLLGVLLTREGGDGPPAAPAAVASAGQRDPVQPADQVELDLVESAESAADVAARAAAPAVQEDPAPEPAAPNQRVSEAHRIAVVYLCSLEQSSDQAALGRMRKSLAWHLRILSAKNLAALAGLFPARQWQLVLEAAETDPAARRNLDQALGPQAWAHHVEPARRRSSQPASSSAAA